MGLFRTHQLALLWAATNHQYDAANMSRMASSIPNIGINQQRCRYPESA